MTKFKRLLVLSIAGVLGLGLAACNNDNPSSTPAPSTPVEQPSTPAESTPAPSTPVESTPVVEKVNYAEEIKVLLDETFKDATTRIESFTLPAVQRTYDAEDNPVLVDVVWTLTPAEGSLEGIVVMGELDEETKTYPVTIVYDEEHNTEDVNFTLSCVITDPNGNEETLSYEYKVPRFQYASFETIKEEAAKGKEASTLTSLGTVVAIYKSGVYFIDQYGTALYAYSPSSVETVSKETLLAAYPIGSTIKVSGTPELYYGGYQYGKGCSVTSVEAAPENFEIEYTDITEAFAAVESSTDKSLNQYINKPVSLNVTFAHKDVANSYYYFNVADSDVNFYFRPSDSYNDFVYSTLVSALCSEWEAGYEATIRGIVMTYNNAHYITPVEMDAVEVTNRTLSDSAKVDVALSDADITFSALNAAGSYDLPATDANGVTLTYSVKEGSTGIAIVEGKLVLTEGAEETVNTLVVTATSGESTDTREITITIPAAGWDLLTYDEVVALGDGAKGKFYYGGVVTKVVNAKYGNVNVKDENGKELLVYGSFDGEGKVPTYTVGDYVIFHDDQISAYNGAVQLKDSTLVANFGAVATETTTAQAILTAGAGLTENNQVVEGEYSYYVAGLVTEVAKAQYGNIYIEDATGTSLYVYGTYLGETETVPTYNVGDYVVLEIDCISIYNSKVQAKNAHVVAQYDATNKEVDYPLPPAPAFENYSLDMSSLFTELFPGGTATDKTVLDETSAQISSLGLLDVVGNVQARTPNSDTLDSIKYVEIAKNEGGALTFTAPEKVTLTLTVASTGSSNQSEFAVKVGDAYVACNETPTAQEGDLTAATLYSTATENVYSVYGTGDGVTVTYTIDEGSVVTIISPSGDLGRGFKISALSVEKFVEVTPDPDPTPDPEPSVITTIEAALAGAEGAAVELTGEVVGIYQAYNPSYGNVSVYIADEAGNKILAFRMTGDAKVHDIIKVTGTITLYNGTMQIAQGCTFEKLGTEECSEFTEATCKTPSSCKECGTPKDDVLAEHNYVEGVCSECSAVDPEYEGEVTLPSVESVVNLSFSGAANKASADDYLKTNYPDWTITGKLGQTYGGYLGFGRSGDVKSAITSKVFAASSDFQLTAVLKGNGSSGVSTSTVVFEILDSEGNVIATSETITPADGKDTTYTVSFTYVEGKSYADAAQLRLSFSKATSNIGLKSLVVVG